MPKTDLIVRENLTLSNRNRIRSAKEKSTSSCGSTTVLLIALSLAAVIGCGDESKGPTVDVKPSFNIETEPSLSFDREFVYFIGNDEDDSALSGIYRARVTEPVRELILSGTDLHSPTVSPDNSTVAYLKGERVHFLRLSDGKDVPATINAVFESLLWVNDTSLIGSRDDMLYLVDQGGRTSTLLRSGWDPSLISTNEIAAFIPSLEGTYLAISFDPRFMQSSSLFVIQASSRPHWPSVDTSMANMAFSVTENDSHQIHLVQQPVMGSKVIAVSSRHPKALFIDLQTILFTGPDGRLYRTNMNGSQTDPFWYVDGPQ